MGDRRLGGRRDRDHRRGRALSDITSPTRAASCRARTSRCRPPSWPRRRSRRQATATAIVVVKRTDGGALTAGRPGARGAARRRAQRPGTSRSLRLPDRPAGRRAGQGRSQWSRRSRRRQPDDPGLLDAVRSCARTRAGPGRQRPDRRGGRRRRRASSTTRTRSTRRSPSSVSPPSS